MPYICSTTVIIVFIVAKFVVNRCCAEIKNEKKFDFLARSDTITDFHQCQWYENFHYSILFDDVNIIGAQLTCNEINEEYQCGSACQTTCENIGQPCPIVNIRCNDACYCKDGFARNKNGKCIPIDDCQKRKWDLFNIHFP